MQIMGYFEALGPISLLKDVLLKNSNRRCLIVGAGGETHLVSKFSDDIVGVNISLEELRRVKQLKTNLILGDAQSLPIKKCSVDFIVCKSTLHHFDNLNVAMSEMNRVLRKGSYIVLYEPGLLNPIAFFGRKFFPTDIHESSERPFNPIGLRKLLIKHFQVISEKDFFLFAHIIPILGKRLNFLGNHRFLSAIFDLDALFCKTFLRNFCWIMVFVLRKDHGVKN